MRSLGKIFLYVVLVLLGGALAAPQAWHLIQGMPPEWLGGLIGKVQGMPFHRYLSRSLQVAAILLLWPLLRSLRVRSLREFGLFPDDRPGRDLLAGVAAGVVSVLLLQPALLASGAFALHALWSPGVLPRILLTAVVVALLEEFLFRGVILGFFRQSMRPSWAVLCSSLLFASLHFFNLPSSSGREAPRWSDGLAALGAMGAALPSGVLFCWAFGSLVLAGMILAWVTIRTGSLWTAVGLHGCWIFGQQLFASLAAFRGASPAEYLPWCGPAQCHGAVPVGIIPLLSLMVAGGIAAFLLQKRPLPPVLPAHRGDCGG